VVILERFDRGEIGPLELSGKVRLRTEFPVVVVIGETARVPEADRAEHCEHLRRVEHRPVFVEVFVGHGVGVGLREPIDELGCQRLIVEDGNVGLPHLGDDRQGLADAGDAVALGPPGEVPQQRADGEQARPAGHAVVSHLDDAVRLEVPADDLEHACPQFRADPAEHPVQRDEVERRQIGGHLREVGTQHPHVAQARGGDLPRDVVGVHGHEVDAGEAPLRVRRRERQERAAEAAAEFQEIEALPDRGRPNALQRCDISHAGRGHEGVVARQVGDIGDVAGGRGGWGRHGRGFSEICRTGRCCSTEAVRPAEPAWRKGRTRG
jgi:hypothetical protein